MAGRAAEAGESLMYAGHFAAALALKAVEPKAPTTALLIGVGVLDLFFGLFLALGIERVTPVPEFAPGFSLDFIDWSHSLVSAVVLSVAYAALFFRRGLTVAWACGLSVLSHFFLDFPFHPGDLALAPHSETHFGLGWWRTFPTGWWFIELAVVLAGLGLYAWKGRKLGTFAQRPLATAAVMLFLHVGFSPWAQALLH